MVHNRLEDPDPAKFVLAITYASERALSTAWKELKTRDLSADHKSQSYAFSHTEYYSKEMGDSLHKQFFSLSVLQPLDYLAALKQITSAVEDGTACNGRRTVNIDPSYLELGKLVVASHKNFDHRIYIGNGVYGDVQLRFRKGRFVNNDWTYPDYSMAATIQFLEQVRGIYRAQLRQRS